MKRLSKNTPCLSKFEDDDYKYNFYYINNLLKPWEPKKQKVELVFDLVKEICRSLSIDEILQIGIKLTLSLKNPYTEFQISYLLN